MLQDQKLPVVENSNDEIDEKHEIKFNLYFRYKEEDMVHKYLSQKLKDSWKFNIKDLE